MRMEEKMQAQGDTIIVMRDIIKRFYIGTPNELQILNGISLDVKKGEFLSIVGASGSGKSTLMNIIGALDRPTEGTYLLDGLRVDQAKDDQLSVIRNRKIGFVFQTFNLIPRTSALKNVELPMLYANVPLAKRTARAKELLEMVELPGDFVDRYPHNMSGGQRQRISIARTLLKNTDLLIYDEPTSNLDHVTAKEVEKNLLNRNNTCIMITHRLEENLLERFDEILVLDHGTLAESGTFNDLLERKGVFYSLYKG